MGERGRLKSPSQKAGAEISDDGFNFGKLGHGESGDKRIDERLPVPRILLPKVVDRQISCEPQGFTVTVPTMLG
jgi:hypothetical protein